MNTAEVLWYADKEIHQQQIHMVMTIGNTKIRKKMATKKITGIPEVDAIARALTKKFGISGRQHRYCVTSIFLFLILDWATSLAVQK